MKTQLALARFGAGEHRSRALVHRIQLGIGFLVNHIVNHFGHIGFERCQVV